MADISQEIDRLRNAVYGEEVRGAFISCMQKIHEENESYNSIKESVDASAATMKKIGRASCRERVYVLV